MEGSAGHDAAFAEFSEGPVVLSGELINDGVLLQGTGQDFPRVRFHLEMVAQAGLAADFVQDTGDMLGGGFEPIPRRRVEGDVEMHAPLDVELGAVEGGGEGFVEVGVPDDFAVGPTFDDLMEVDGIEEGSEGLAGGRGGMNPEGVAEMDLGDEDSCPAETTECLSGRLELDGEVAAVVIDAEVGIEAQVARSVGPQSFEEPDRFVRGLQVAAGLGFESEMEATAGAAGKLFEEFDDGPEVFPGCPFGAVVEAETLEGDGNGAHRAVDLTVVRQQFGEDFEEASRVSDAVCLGPVGAVDLFLDAGAMEPAEGKSVDREDVAVVLLQPTAEGLEGIRMREFAGGDIGEAQADGIGLVWGDAAPDGERVLLQGREGFRPRFTAMDVRAVGQMNTVRQAHGCESNPWTRRKEAGSWC